MKKIVLWIIGLSVGVPLAFVAFAAFVHFVFYPLQHDWHVYRMDAKNDQVWREALARVVTIETDVQTREGSETLTSEIVCHNGYWARGWDLKAGAPKTGRGGRSVGFQASQAELSTGAILDIDLRFLCWNVFRNDTFDVPRRLDYAEMHLVAPELFRKCRYHHNDASGAYFMDTEVAKVGYPFIVSIEERPLREVASRAEMGSSETPRTSGFNRRWGGDLSRYETMSDETCRTGRLDG